MTEDIVRGHVKAKAKNTGIDNAGVADCEPAHSCVGRAEDQPVFSMLGIEGQGGRYAGFRSPGSVDETIVMAALERLGMRTAV